MKKFLFVYHGGKMPDTPEEGAKEMARWQAWMGGLGEALVEPGAPVGKSSTVSAQGVTNDGGANPASGYSIVLAPDLGAAIEMAKGCPILGNGSVEIAEIIQM